MRRLLIVLVVLAAVLVVADRVGVVVAQNALAGQIKQQAELDDINLQLQDQAQALWNDQDRFCGGKSIEDNALDTVLARVGHE